MKIVLVPLTRRKSSHALEPLAMTGSIDRSHVSRLIDSARRSLEQTGETGHDVRLVGPAVATARSRVVPARPGSPTADYVLKEPLAGDAAAGYCLRALHEHGRRSRTEVALRDLAEEVRQVADAGLRPVGSRQREEVEEALGRVPATVVPVIEGPQTR